MSYSDWEEQRRNLTQNPRSVQGGSTAEAARRWGWTLSYLSGSGLPESDAFIRTQVNNGSVGTRRGVDWGQNMDTAPSSGYPVIADEPVHLSAWARVSRRATVSFGARIHVAGNWTGASWDGQQTLDPGQWVRIERTIIPTVTGVLAVRLEVDATGWEASDYLDQALPYIGAPGPYFDGSTPPQSDLERFRWLGEPNASPSVHETRRLMATRASDQVTLQVLPSPSYVRTYYLLQASTLAPPSVPATNPPPTPWSTTEPGYTAGSTNTLYTVMLTAYGTAAFEYGPVQKSSAYEAAKQAYNLATQARETADGKNKIFSSITEPTATAAGDQWWLLDPTGESIVGVKMWNGTTWVPYQLVADEIIAAESITSPLIKAGSLEVDRVSPSFGNDLQISANSSVQIIVGRVDEQASSIASVQGGVSAAQTAAQAANSQAGAAQATANGAQSAATAAGAAAADVGARLDKHQTYYRFTSTELAIGDPKTNAELGLAPDGIRVRQNNVVVSEWVGGVFIAPEARLQSASIANHQWLPYGPGRTIVRPL